MNSKKHALLSASGSKRWMACPRSALFSLQFPPSVSSKYAQEGTTAHGIAEKVLRDEVLPTGVDQEMLKHVMTYCNYVASKAQGNQLSIEEHGNLLWLHPELKGGTADAVIRSDWEIEVIDLKYGAGVSVSPVNNTQAMMYALMALYNPQMGRIDTTYEKVTITIVQPRCGDEVFRSWETTVEYLMEFAAELKDCAEKAMKEDAPFCTGDHCRWCPCEHGCPELQRVTKEVIAADFQVLPDVEKLTDDQIANVIKHKSVIEGFIKACEEFALNKLAVGTKVQGLKLVRGRGSRDWNAPQEEIEQKLLELTSPDTIFLSGLKSVAQIEKVIGKKAMEEFTVKKEGKIIVAAESDKRQAVTIVSPDDFELVNEGLLE